MSPYKVEICGVNTSKLPILNDEEKENDSYLFAVKYKDDISGFLDFITNSDFSVVNGYKESWDFIKQDHNSLKRFTNLGLCFKGE